MEAKRLVKAALAALALSSFLAPAYSEPKQELISKVLDVTGIEKQFSDLSGVIAAMYQGQQQQLPGEAYGKIIDIINDSFGGTNFSAYIQKEMGAGYREDYCLAIAKTYESKLFKDVTAREIDAMRPEETARIEGLDYSKVSAGRDGIFESFMEEGKSLENQKRVTTSAVRAFIYTYNILLPEGRKIGKDVEAQALQGVGQQLSSPDSRLRTKKYLAIIYEPFSDAQLKEYFAFYSSAAGKWLNGIVFDGFEKGFAACMTDAANKLKEAFNLGA
jgi:hypothetical protein